MLMAIGVKKWNGSAWVNTTVKKYTSSGWQDAYTYKRTSSGWAQIYPETHITITDTISSTALDCYKPSWGYWCSSAGKNSPPTARQGNGTSYGGSKYNCGFLGVNASKWEGTKNITSITSATFSSTRGGSGSHGSNITLQLRRSGVKPTTVPIDSSYNHDFVGKFETIAKAGSGSSFTSDITLGDYGMNWFNQVSSKPYLYIYAGNTASEYVSIKDKVSITAKYTYKAATVSYDYEPQTVSLASDVPSTLAGNKSQIKMIIHPDEINMSFEEVMSRREKGISRFIDLADINTDYKPHPWTREYEIKDGKARIEIFDMQWDNEAQYSIDKVNWYTMYSEEKGTAWLSAELPPEFNSFSDYIYIRVINKKTDSIDCQTAIEPTFIVL